MEKTVYRWRVTHPTHGAVVVTGPRKYEALIAAAKRWGTRWTQIAQECTFERLGEVAPK